MIESANVTCQTCGSNQLGGSCLCSSCGASLTPFVKSRLEQEVEWQVTAKVLAREDALLTEQLELARQTRMSDVRDALRLARKRFEETRPTTLAEAGRDILANWKGAFWFSLIVIPIVAGLALSAYDAFGLSVATAIVGAAVAVILSLCVVAHCWLRIVAGSRRWFQARITENEDALRALEAAAPKGGSNVRSAAQLGPRQ